MPPKKESKVKKVRKIRGVRAARSSAAKKGKKGINVRQKVTINLADAQGRPIDYGFLRPTATVDVPIRAAAPMAESIATRAAEPIPLRSSGIQTDPVSTGLMSREIFSRIPPPEAYEGLSPPSSDIEEKHIGKKKGRPSGSKNKPKPIAVAVGGGTAAATEQPVPYSLYAQMLETQKAGSFMPSE